MILPPPLPPAPSWYPGHMSRFTRLLPAFLTRTDIVIELRDARLPLTSVNPVFESAIKKWQFGRRKGVTAGAGASAQGHALCERIIVLGKKDLVGQWGVQPFSNAMRKFLPGDHIHFTSHVQPRTVRDLGKMLISMASQRAEPMSEVNVLVVGMPNVGKSTLLNALRNHGIPATPKALRTSAHPGLTRALSTRLKLSLDPLVYAFDSPGVMIPFLGRGDRAAERGIKLALIAGIKEGMYDMEALAAYLVYRLWVLNPHCPAYMALLPPATSPPCDVYEFLSSLSSKLRMLQKGGEPDLGRAAHWFIKWWREEGGLLSASSSPLRHVPEKLDDGPATQLQSDSGTSLSGKSMTTPSDRIGWGFDFEWDMPGSVESEPSTLSVATIQTLMEQRIEAHMSALEEDKQSGDSVSLTQEKKQAKEEKIARRRARTKVRK